MSHAARAEPAEWTPDLIRQEVRRRHLTFTGIALAAGLREDACRKALYGYNRQGADALCEALGIPFDTLFPTGFIQSRRQASVKRLQESRQKRIGAPDKAGVRA